MKVVVMAGGEGTRLRPLTMRRPKPLAPVLNKPLLGHILGLLRAHGLVDVMATVHYLAHEVEAAFGDGGQHGVRLRYSRETRPLGTAGSVKACEAYLADSPFLVVSGDALTDVDLSEVIAFHRQTEAAVTLALSRVADPTEYGIVVTGPDGRVRRFLEKPSWSQVFTDTVNTGIYVIEPRVLSWIDPDRPVDFSKDLFPRLLAAGEPLYGFVAGGYWCDVGSLSAYREAHWDAFDGRVELAEPGAAVPDGVVKDPSAVVDPTARLAPPAAVGPGCRIGPGATVGPYTALGAGTVVEADASVSRSVLWEEVFVGRGARVEGAVLCSRAAVGPGARLDPGAVAGDGAVVGAGARLDEGVKLWPARRVLEGVRQRRSLVAEAGLQPSLLEGAPLLDSSQFGGAGRPGGISGLIPGEVSVERVMRLSAAFGRLAGGPIMLAGDGSRAAGLCLRAAAAALLSRGIDVREGGEMCLAALRLAMRAAGPAGGIYCCAGAGERQAQVRLVGADGADLPREALRQLESLVGKETEEPGAAAALGRSLPAPGGMERYAQAVAEAFGLKEAAPVGQPVAVAAPRRLRRWLEAVLAPWCELVWLDEPEPGGFAGTPGGPSPTGAAASARKAMRAAGAAFGACLHGDPPGERLFLWDGDGAAIDGDRLIAFFADIRLEGRPGGEVMLSAGASQRHEAFCRSRGGAAVRAPHALGELMQAAKGRIACALAADGRGGFVFPDLHPGPDGIAALACALAAGPGIGGRMAALPQFYMEERWVPCPVERTGHVLRLLAEEGAGEDAKGATDGVRVVRPEGWVLAVPEGSPPRFRLIAEGRDAASARRLAERYAKRIEALAEGA